MFFALFIAFVIIQRLIELAMAKSNEKWSKNQGAIEFGSEHYKYIITLHVLFFISLIIEYWLDPELIDGWPAILAIFLCAQILRYWSIFSLGKHWNTKILVIPDAPPVRKGPYRYMKHPNYFVVAIELITIPLMFGAYVTAFVFSVLNFILLYFIRIPKEEQALQLFRPPTQK